MKKVILILLVLTTLIGCIPNRHIVNVRDVNNYYQKNRYNTYTIPLWVPGIGIILETRTYHPHNKWKQPLIKRKRR